MNFMNPINQTFTAFERPCSLHNPAAAIKPAPHPDHVITSHPCVCQCVPQVTADSLRREQEVPADSQADFYVVKINACHVIRIHLYFTSDTTHNVSWDGICADTSYSSLIYFFG